MIPLIGLPALDCFYVTPVGLFKCNYAKCGDEIHCYAFDKTPMPTIDAGGRNAPQPRPKFLLEIL
jgi:hypothetical protein